MKDSEEIFDFCCSTCAENGRNKEANKYCKNCAQYFCDECLKFHSMFPALRNHAITDTTGPDVDSRTNVSETKEELPTCQVHHGQTVEKFCRDHHEICCKTCIAAKHRTCKNLVEITDAAKGVRNSTDYTSKKSALVEVLDSLTKEKTKKTKNLEEQQTYEENLLQSIEKYREELIATINGLAEKSKLEVTKTCLDIETTTNTDISVIDTIIASTTLTLQKLTTESDIQAFVHSITCTPVIEEGQHLAKDLSQETEKRGIEHSINREVMGSISRLETLLIRSEVEENVKEYVAMLYRQVHLFSKDSSISGICRLDDGTILVANFSENRLIRYDENFKEEDSANITAGNPYGLCQTGSNEVAICAGSKVQFFTISKTLNSATEIDVGLTCYGIAYIPEKKEIVISCGSLLKVYKQDLNSFICSIEKDNNGAALLSASRQCIFSPILNLLLVADLYKGLVALNKDGELQWVFSDPELKNAWGVCVLPGGSVLVCGYASNNIIQLNKNGEKMSSLVCSIGSPFSMACDVKKSRLIVGCHSKEMHVFCLKTK